jgi:hypothetical protein
MITYVKLVRGNLALVFDETELLILNPDELAVIYQSAMKDSRIWRDPQSRKISSIDTKTDLTKTIEDRIEEPKVKRAKKNAQETE